MKRGRHHGRMRFGTRSRWRSTEGEWRVRARLERVAEPALLLLLRERPRHGYELLDELPSLVGDERIDMGNLYRVLRALEEDGLLESEWQADAPGPAKRTYSLTDDGRAVLDLWARAIADSRDALGAFLARYEEGR